jgi:DNA polymerase-3 subunit gamma/tau
MENFIVSARKYRPSSFSTVIGQSSLTTTLQSAIQNNQLGQAYLFTGPRGVGKTTSARLLAKTINCSNLSDNIEACNECESCVSFNEGRSYNIHELDAASNNSVDDIRIINDQVRIKPQLGNYSVYIIDEVHMLSASAFNAFLKTLEEPPKHVIFILATTEKHKIPATILSRCQIFDFNRIKNKDIVRNLEHIAKNEKINYEPEALSIIATKSDGGMRDALSIFDQAVSFSGNDLSYKNIISILGLLDFNYFVDILNSIHQNNYVKALMTLNEILENGFDGMHFLNGLTEHIRNVLVAKDPESVKLLDMEDERKDFFIENASKFDVRFLLEAIEVVNEYDLTYKTSGNKRLHTELALLKLCKIMLKKKA